MKTKSIIITSLILLMISSGVQAQRYFIDVYEDMRDTTFYPKISSYLETQKFDSAVMVGQQAFDYYWELQDYDKAIYHLNAGMYLPTGYGLMEVTESKLQAALDVMRQDIDTINPHFAITHQILAFAYKFQKKMPQAINHYKVTEQIYEQLGISGVQRWGLYESMGSVLVYSGEPLSGYYYLNNALKGFQQKQMYHEISHIYLEMAMAMTENDQDNLALAFDQKALDIIKAHNPYGYNHVVVPSNMASVYIELEEYENALKSSKYADSVMLHYHKRDVLYHLYFSILANQGIAYRSLKNYDKANEYLFELVAQIKKYLGATHPVVGDGLMEIAQVFYDSQQYDSALVYYQKILQYQPPSPNLYNNMGKAFAEMHQKDSSAYYFQSAVNMLCGKDLHYNGPYAVKEFQNPEFGFDATVDLMMSYFSDSDVSDYPKGMALAYKADSLMHIINEGTLIGAYDKEKANKYHDFATAVMKYLIKNNPEDVNSLTYFMSRAKAFKLSGQINQTGIVAKGNADTLQYQQVSLMKEIRKLENESLAFHHAKADKEESDSLNNLLFESRILAFENSAKLKKKAHKQNLDFGPGQVSAEEVKNALEKGVLISYHVSGDEVLAVGFSKDKIIAKEIVNDEEFKAIVKKYFRSLKSGRAIDHVGQQLYDVLLSPFETLFSGKNDLVIIPDGLLHQIPFEGFIHNGKYLIESHAVSYHYSLSMWMNSIATAQKSESLLAFAPVFDNQQLLADNSPVRTDSLVYRDFDEVREGKNLAPLLFSAKEVNELNVFFKGQKRHVVSYLRDQATESAFKASSFNYDILHIATHGFTSKRDPELSGIFFYDEKNEDLTNDGFLYSGEIFGLNLNADLVVLSACKSGYGKVVEGEGVLALPRGFIFGGAKNVIASLWKVNDMRTQQMITEFYKDVAKGESYKKALQKAKIKMIKKGELPIDWSGFVLIGR